MNTADNLPDSMKSSNGSPQPPTDCRPSLHQIKNKLLPDLVEKAFRQDGIMAPSQVIDLALMTGRILEHSVFLQEHTDDLNQRLEDIQHTRPPWL